MSRPAGCASTSRGTEAGTPRVLAPAQAGDGERLPEDVRRPRAASVRRRGSGFSARLPRRRDPAGEPLSQWRNRAPGAGGKSPHRLPASPRKLEAGRPGSLLDQPAPASALLQSYDREEVKCSDWLTRAYRAISRSPSCRETSANRWGARPAWPRPVTISRRWAAAAADNNPVRFEYTKRPFKNTLLLLYRTCTDICGGALA